MDLKKSKGIICWTFSFSKLPFNISIPEHSPYIYLPSHKLLKVTRETKTS